MVRVHGTVGKGLALTADWHAAILRGRARSTGGAQAVAEAWRNLTATGARPLAVTDNMNFGNPERPEIMGQFVGCIKGMAEACRALDFPVVSGNVSLYNETNGQAILPTPAIGAVGLIADLDRIARIGFADEGDVIILIGETRGQLGRSLYRRELMGLENGPPPALDLEAERRNGDFVRTLIMAGEVRSCHDVSDGGLLVALAEMALAGNLGARIEVPPEAAAHAWFFGEDQGRYLLSVPPELAQGLLDRASVDAVPAEVIGAVDGDALTVAASGHISLDALRQAHEDWLPGYMAGG